MSNIYLIFIIFFSFTNLNTFFEELWAEELGHNGTVTSLALNKQATFLISGGHDGTVRLWNLREIGSMQYLLDYRGAFVDFTDAYPPREVMSVDIDQKGELVVAGFRDRTVRIWSLNNDETTKVMRGHKGGVLAVSINPASTLVASGGHEPVVRVWDLQTGAQIKVFEGHVGSVNSVKFTSDGMRVITGGQDGVLRIWDVLSGGLIKELKPDCGVINGIAVSKRPIYFVAGCWEKAVLWKEPDGEPFVLPHGDLNWVASVDISQDGKSLLTGDGKGVVRIWDAIEGKELNKFLGNEMSEVRSVILGPDQKLAISGGDDGIYMWRLGNDHRLFSGGDKKEIH
ncbi:MAG: WD40 repeat domain-containing protein [Nitrospira sp.]|nr:WD40 repeat domain-containing protein [Nitrospira sp.]